MVVVVRVVRVRPAGMMRAVGVDGVHGLRWKRERERDNRGRHTSQPSPLPSMATCVSLPRLSVAALSLSRLPAHRPSVDRWSPRLSQQRVQRPDVEARGEIEAPQAMGGASCCWLAVLLSLCRWRRASLVPRSARPCSWVAHEWELLLSSSFPRPDCRWQHPPPRGSR